MAKRTQTAVTISLLPCDMLSSAHAINELPFKYGNEQWNNGRSVVDQG